MAHSGTLGGGPPARNAPLYSALAALAVGLSYEDFPLEEGLHALTELDPLPGRMRPLAGLNGSLLVDDSFCC